MEVAKQDMDRRQFNRNTHGGHDNRGNFQGVDRERDDARGAFQSGVRENRDHRTGYLGQDRDGRRFQGNDYDARGGRAYGTEDQGNYGYRGNRG